MSGPLSGVTILDISTVVSGPLATMHLADQGANVIKVEPPGGDINRRSRQKVSENGQFSALFISTNRGKRSIALDLKNPQAMEVFRNLLLKADVLVQNFRPGITEKLGIGPEDVERINPRVIYVSISGVGDDGPYVRKRIYDPMIQALSGLADIQSDKTTGRPQMIRTILADKTTSIFAAQAITAALYAREKTGVGQHIRLSLLGTMLSFLWPEAMMQYTVVGREKTAASTNTGPDLVFETRDGFMTVGTISDAEWQGFCDAVEHPELKDDARFATAELRNLNSTERINLMAAILREGYRDEWLRRLDAADVPCAPVLRRNEIIENAQVVAMNLVRELDQPSVGVVRQPQPAAVFDDTPSEIRGPAPSLGEHTRDILSELGLTEDAIESLIASGAAKAS
ncbi:Crotonobetainyl-CoA:carnitine CoA-transferase CaiB [Burkholderia sp. D7]|jgi:crotonobetainyl-CoA:carnitine CoA-transferase CaiB-like acyl-CoA transferase|nr:Crotonobetainyl-CoA:carnitine CoA-transferase CaiB [Burkholderia sp. D7]